jgi:hypothetical protein
MKKVIKSFAVLIMCAMALAFINTVGTVLDSSTDKAVAIASIQQSQDTTSGHVVSEVAIETGQNKDTILPLFLALLSIGVIVLTSFLLILIVTSGKKEISTTEEVTK